MLTPGSLVGTLALTTLAFVLARAAVAKLRSPRTAPSRQRRVELLSLAELALAALALAAPARLSAPVLALAFGGFAVEHARRWRSGAGDCECFGEASRASGGARTQVGITGVSALVMAGAAVAAPPSLLALATHSPGAALVVAIGGLLAADVWRLAFIGAARPGRLGERLVLASASFLERRVSRRTLLQRVALTGSALAVAPLRYLLYPVSALAAISPGDCSGGLCTDGYTVFCCEINNGQNTCPGGTFPGGWWMCTSYSGAGLCAPQGVRYYVDCNALPGSGWGCSCAFGSCANRREACNIFRYGQCNTDVGGVTAVVCRMIVCENPGSIPGLNCGSSVAVDDAVCGQNVPCLDVPQAVELAGAGGV